MVRVFIFEFIDTSETKQQRVRNNIVKLIL